MTLKDHLKKICDEAANHSRPMFTQPWSVKFGQVVYSVAVNEWQLVAIPRAFDPPGRDEYRDKFAPLVAPVVGVRAPLAAICVWAEPPQWSSRVTGFCESCDEMTMIATQPDVRGGVFGGVPFNRNLIAQALAPFQDTTVIVELNGPQGSLRVGGDGWIAVVMPMHHVDAGSPEFVLP